nr:hypothetical protein [Tanacetum cinerariifolium]
MSSTFADTYNMVAILNKSEASEGFNQIIDFLNGSYIQYTLTINPHIYMSCIKQFWNTVTVKQSNDVTRLQALVDRKKVVLTETVIRDVLCLDDAEGVDCLPNEEIFAGLARMGYEKQSIKLTFYKDFFSSQWKFLIHTILQSMSAKRTSWNEFSSAMASAVICLSTCHKFNISKYIFESLVRNVDSRSKLYMYPRVGKGCSRVETPLFERMLVVGEPEEQDQSIPSPTPPTPPPQQPQDIPSTSQVQSPPPQPHSPTLAQPQGVDFPMNLLQEALDACAALTRRVEHLERDKVAQDLEITKLKIRVKKMERANKLKALKLRRLNKVGTSQIIESSDDINMEDASNQGRMIAKLDKDTGVPLMVDEGTKKKTEAAQVVGDEQVKGRQAEIYQINMDHAAKVLSMQEDELEVQEAMEVVTTAKLITKVVAAVSESVSAASVTIVVVPAATITAVPVRVADKGKGIMVEEPKPMKKMQQVKMDEAYARKLHEELNQDIDWDVAIDHIKQKAKEDPYVQGYQEEENRALEGINETLAQKAAKRRKLNEEVKDVEEIKQHVEIVPDEDDDVYTKATPLARKVLVVDYQIIQLNNKPCYKIIRADGTQQLYVSFVTLLKNFDREDLESLWSRVKERFSTSKPNNYSDDYLLTTLRAMFGRPDGQDQVWKSQRNVHGQAKVKS